MSNATQLRRTRAGDLRMLDVAPYVRYDHNIQHPHLIPHAPSSQACRLTPGSPSPRQLARSERGVLSYLLRSVMAVAPRLSATVPDWTNSRMP